MLSAFFRRRREAAEHQAYRRGYDYAAGALLRHPFAAPAVLQEEADREPNHPFDRGMAEALLDFRALTMAVKRRD